MSGEDFEHLWSETRRTKDFYLILFPVVTHMNLYSAYTDEQLLSFLRKNDEHAFREIYDRYWRGMLGMAYLRLRRREIAEDVVQDIFTSLWQRRKKLSIITLEPWLATAVKFKIISLVNRRLTREISSEKIPEETFLDNTIDFEFLREMVSIEINKLPEKCRIIFKYSRELGLSNSEIAEEFQISEKAVEKHITHARKQLSFHLRQPL